MYPLLASLFTMMGIFLIFLGLTRPKRPNPIETRLTTYAVRPRTLEEIELQQPFYERTIKPIALRLAGFIAQRTPQGTIAEIRHDLLVAGNPSGLQVNDFLGIKGLAAIVLGGLAFFLMGMADVSFLYKSLGPLIAAFLGFYLPNFWLKGKITARQKDIQLSLPDALDLLVISVEAGLGFDQAMQKVAEKWDNSLTREFSRVLAETRMGKLRRDALRDMADRCEVPDLKSFAAAIIQADQLGVSISRILVIQAEQMRMKRRQRAEKLAHEAPIKMLIPMALFMLPTIYLVILGPMIPKIMKMFGGGGGF